MSVMKKIGIFMTCWMGVILGFLLSFLGMMSSGHFTVPGFFIGALESVILSLIIGLVLDVRAITLKIGSKLQLTPSSKGYPFFMALVSDIIFTPLMCFAALALKMGLKKPMFLQAFCRTLLTDFIIAYFVILLIMPVGRHIASKLFKANIK